MTGRLTSLCRNVGQSNHVLANSIGGHKVERRPGAAKWLAATKHDRVEVELILINKPKVGQASCQVRSANLNLPDELSLSPRITASRPSSTSVALGPTDFNECDTTHFGWRRHAAAKSRSSASHSE